MARSLREERVNACNVTIIQSSVISDQPRVFRGTLCSASWCILPMTGQRLNANGLNVG
jgi:hypothetical protein